MRGRHGRQRTRLTLIFLARQVRQPVLLRVYLGRLRWEAGSWRMVLGATTCMWAAPACIWEA